MATLRAAGPQRCVSTAASASGQYVGLTSVHTKLADEFSRRLPRAA